MPSGLIHSPPTRAHIFITAGLLGLGVAVYEQVAETTEDELRRFKDRVVNAATAEAKHIPAALPGEFPGAPGAVCRPRQLQSCPGIGL